jgi:hypothetical protein
MKMLIIMITFIIGFNLYSSEIDSLTINIRINNAIEYIKNDSLFLNTVFDSCSSELTFYIQDSTTYPIIFPDIIKKLFIDCSKNKLSDKELGDIWRSVRNEKEYYFGHEKININNKLQTEFYNYELILMKFALPELFAFYVFPMQKCNKSIGIVIYFIYDKNNKIIASLTRQNIWSN